MFSTVLTTYPFVPRRLIASVIPVRMKSKGSGKFGQLPQPAKAVPLRRSDLPFVTFASVIEARREEAKRTIFVQVQVLKRNNFFAQHLQDKMITR